MEYKIDCLQWVPKNSQRNGTVWVASVGSSRCGDDTLESCTEKSEQICQILQNSNYGQIR